MSHPAPRRDLVGKLIANRYLVGEVLGAGGLCTVYRGEDLRRQREVAIKVLPPDKARVKEFAARFGREVTTAKRIEHPNVAAITDNGELPDGALFLVMELLKGTLLSNALADGRMAPPHALVIARQMLVGLGRAHALGVVHRDVKPDNVMLIKVSGLDTVKLFDFGIASNDRAAIQLTVPGTAFGTPEYIAPEQAMGLKVDQRADIYAVGVVLFEMLTGRLPFECKDDIAYLRAHIKEQPPKPSAVAPDATIAAAVDTIVLRALDKDPDKRFTTTDEMIAAIDSAAGHKPLEYKDRRMLWVALLLLAITAALIIAARYYNAPQ
ncbi:MAG: serine/threonine protein kinase [Myxococcales bacterium]|nr:serine/threonine protein kinase [Myxococcales bacterium]